MGVQDRSDLKQFACASWRIRPPIFAGYTDRCGIDEAICYPELSPSISVGVGCIWREVKSNFGDAIRIRIAKEAAERPFELSPLKPSQRVQKSPSGARDYSIKCLQETCGHPQGWNIDLLPSQQVLARLIL